MNNKEILILEDEQLDKNDDVIVIDDEKKEDNSEELLIDEDNQDDKIDMPLITDIIDLSKETFDIEDIKLIYKELANTEDSNRLDTLTVTATSSEGDILIELVPGTFTDDEGEEIRIGYIEDEPYIVYETEDEYFLDIETTPSELILEQLG